MKIFKKNITIVALVTFLVSLVISSCTNDLNIVPNDDQTTLASDLFNDESAYKEVLAGVYGNFSLTGTDGAGTSNLDGIDAGTSQYGRVLLYMQSFSSDELIWSYENDPGIREIQRNIWTAQNPLLLGLFERIMASVSFANNFLRETTDAKLDERNVSAATRSDIVTFRAEARLIRALAYYHLMDLFGKAPFVTEDTAINSLPSQFDRTELFAFIESEITDIESDLIAPRQNEHGRVDKAVAWMILAKMYLNAEVYINENRYSDCINYCNQIIGSGYSLATNYLHNFMADNDTNSAKDEIIFSFISDGLFTQNFGPTTVMCNGEVGSIEQNGVSIGVSAGGWGGAIRVRKQFVELFNGSVFNNDTRNTILSAGRDIEISDISDRDQGFILTKYSNRTSADVAGVDQTFVDTDFPLFRLADVYLMYAEAVQRGGGGSVDQAVDYINLLRTRANNPQTINASDLTLDFILDERGRELYAEGHRRQDLIRYGKFTGGNYNWTWKGNASNGIAIPSNLNLYPIPTSSLAANPNLTQNPGY